MQCKQPQPTKTGMSHHSHKVIDPPPGGSISQNNLMPTPWLWSCLSSKLLVTGSCPFQTDWLHPLVLHFLGTCPTHFCTLVTHLYSLNSFSHSPCTPCSFLCSVDFYYCQPLAFPQTQFLSSATSLPLTIFDDWELYISVLSGKYLLCTFSLTYPVLPALLFCLVLICLSCHFLFLTFLVIFGKFTCYSYS